MPISTLPSHPFGQTISYAEIVEVMQNSPDWQHRYRQLILLSRQLPPLGDTWRTPEHEISGCENRVWLVCQQSGEGRLHFYADSEGRIVKGLLTILLAQCDGLLASEILDLDLPAAFAELGLADQLSATRNQGLAAVAEAIQVAAKRAAT